MGIATFIILPFALWLSFRSGIILSIAIRLDLFVPESGLTSEPKPQLPLLQAAGHSDAS
jgi:hypothetical protein